MTVKTYSWILYAIYRLKTRTRREVTRLWSVFCGGYYLYMIAIFIFNFLLGKILQREFKINTDVKVGIIYYYYGVSRMWRKN